jgi:hypothetical protein
MQLIKPGLSARSRDVGVLHRVPGVARVLHHPGLPSLALRRAQAARIAFGLGRTQTVPPGLEDDGRARCGLM